MQINLSNSQKRDAVVEAQTITRRATVRWCDDDGAPATNRKILRATMATDLKVLVDEAGELDKVGQLLVDGDPELDLENIGRFLSETTRVYVTQEGNIAHRVAHVEVVKNPDGSEKERRPRTVVESNVVGDIPLTWTGKKMPKKAVYNKFFFRGIMQIVHTSGLTYDFLFAMAKELAEKDEMMLIAAGEKGKDRLVFRRNAPAYTGFLEGRVEGDKYALLLHLTNMELKAPEEPKEEKKKGAGDE